MLAGPWRRPLLSVFALEDTAVQVVWRTLPARDVTFEIGDRSVTVSARPAAMYHRAHRRPAPLPVPSGGFGGPGAVVIDGLRPGTRYDLTWRSPAGGRGLVEAVSTLVAPPGRLLHKFATINDLHLAERGFGVTHAIEDPWPLPAGWEPYTWRCTRAAIAEAIEWGAETLVVKGDVTSGGTPAEYRAAGAMLAAVPIPVITMFGNHEFHDPATDGRPLLATYGVGVPREAWAQDLPGIRLVLGHTGRPYHRSGRVDAGQRSAIAALAGDAPGLAGPGGHQPGLAGPGGHQQGPAGPGGNQQGLAGPGGHQPGPAFVALHHQPQRWRVANQYPPGIPGPEAGALLDALMAANPATFVASGHTHRHRRHQHGPIPVAEIGSTKDYPGAWAGYAVHEGGIRQVVRRTAAPDVIGWTECSARALFGIWGRWSPGRREERCFSHRWPAR